MSRSAEERANIAQRHMNIKQGRLMAIFEAAGHPFSDEELERAHKEAEEWAMKNTDANGVLKPDAPSIREGLEGWRNG